MGGEAAGDPGRLRLQLGVGELGAVGEQGGAVGAALRALREPVVQSCHRRNVTTIVAAVRSAGERRNAKDAPPEEDLYAPIEWQGAGEYEDILYEKADGIAKITINRPEVRNAFRPQTLAELRDAFTLARDDLEVGAIIFTGAGEEAFCSGGDQRSAATTATSARRGRPQGVGRLDVGELQVQIRRLPKPVVAMVAGYAVGGGHILHLVCDLTIAADNAGFGQTGPGSAPSTAASAPACWRAGRDKKAKEIWFLCRHYDADEALEMGLVNAVVPLAELERETVAWCREMLAPLPLLAAPAEVELQRRTRTGSPASSSSPTTPPSSTT